MILIGIFVVGATVGSFINVVAYRLPIMAAGPAVDGLHLNGMAPISLPTLRQPRPSPAQHSCSAIGGSKAGRPAVSAAYPAIPLGRDGGRPAGVAVILSSPEAHSHQMMLQPSLGLNPRMVVAGDHLSALAAAWNDGQTDAESDLAWVGS